MLSKKFSRRNIKNSPGYSQKTLQSMDFVYTYPPIMVTWKALRADKVSKFVVKAVQEDFSNTCKNLYWLHFPFYNNFLTNGGGAPQILLTVTSCDVFDDLRHTDLLYIIYQYKGIIPSRYFQKCQIRFCRDNPCFIMITAQGDNE